MHCSVLMALLPPSTPSGQPAYASVTQQQPHHGTVHTQPNQTLHINSQLKVKSVSVEFCSSASRTAQPPSALLFKLSAKQELERMESGMRRRASAACEDTAATAAYCKRPNSDRVELCCSMRAMARPPSRPKHECAENMGVTRDGRVQTMAAQGQGKKLSTGSLTGNVQLRSGGVSLKRACDRACARRPEIVPCKTARVTRRATKPVERQQRSVSHSKFSSLSAVFRSSALEMKRAPSCPILQPDTRKQSAHAQTHKLQRAVRFTS